jgi:Cytochrome oxidase complex assembly protein 1
MNVTASNSYESQRLTGDKTWFDRNWRWFIPALCIVCCSLLAVFVLGILALVESMIGRSYPYQMAVEEAQQSEQVAETLGRPLLIGRFSTGQIHSSNDIGEVNISIPISGSRGRGQIIVIGKEVQSLWTFETLEVDIVGNDVPIPLPGPGRP